MPNLVFPEHTKEKLDALNYYYNLWFYIVKSQKCNIIDCNAGTGYVEVRNQNESVLGSSLLGVILFKNDDRKNLTLFLVEKEQKNYELLQKNISEYIKENKISAQQDKQIFLFNSDWASVIESIIGLTHDGKKLFFLDPFAIKSLPWEKLLSLIKMGKSELGYKESGIEILINWAWHAIRRKLGKYYSYKDLKSKNKDLSAPEEIKILDEFFGPINWKKIANEYTNNIFKAKMKFKIEELRDKLIKTYVKGFFKYFRYIKIHSVYSRKKGKKNHLRIRGKVKYFLIFATNYQPALKIIDIKFKEYRDRKIFSTLPSTQKDLSEYIPNSANLTKRQKKIKITIDNKIINLEYDLGMNLFGKTKEIIKFLYGRKHYDYGAFDFALYKTIGIDENSYIPFMIENKILGVRKKRSWSGYEGNYYFLCHPRLVDRNEYLFFNEKRYLFQKGKFVEF